MKKLIFLIVFLLIASNVLADKIMIPFSVYPKEMQKLFAEEGYKLDLDGNDRDVNSWGFLRNEGTQFIIYTYDSITLDELTMIQKVTFKHMR